AAKQRPNRPRNRPSRATPRPDAAIESWERRRAARATSTAAKPKTVAIGAPKPAWSSVTRGETCATAIAAGSAATAASPSANASRASGLLLLVGAANRCRRDRAADHSCDRNQREDVRERLEEDGVRRPVGNAAEPLRERAREAEEERSTESAERPPLPED